MAFGLKHWILTVVVLCAGVAAWALPTRSGFAGRVTPERQRVSEVRAEIRHLSELLQEMRWADSVQVLVREARNAGTAFIVAMPPDASPAGIDTLRQALAAQAGHEPPDVVVGVLAMDSRFGRYPAPQAATLRSLVYFAGLWPTPHCLVVDPYSPNPLSHRLPSGLAVVTRRGLLLGPCHFWARYGMPGGGIWRWLDDRDGYRLTLATATHPASPLRRKAWGLGTLLTYGTWPGSPGERCLDGDGDRCRSLFIGVADTASVTHETGIWPEARPNSRLRFSGYGFELTMLADLEAEFGATRFARFWRSDADVASAFQAAFGVPVGEWVMHWARQRLQPMDAGSLAAPGHLAETLVTLVLAMLLAIAVARRRTVGRT